jgi:broad specificity phosphatase PhoE
MTFFYLVRHAHHDLLGRVLVGRTPGIGLSARGLGEAAALADTLAPLLLDRVLSSAQQRAWQTALPLAERRGLEVESASDLNEIDFGEWTGQTFADLAGDPRWQHFNEHRAGATSPGGESMDALEQRIVCFVARLAAEAPDARLALVSHGDVIRTLLLHAIGLSLDKIHMIDVAPSSVSVLLVEPKGRAVLAVNSCVGLPC